MTHIGGREGANLLPSSHDALVFNIAVKVHSSGETRIKYEFVLRR